MNYLMLMYPNGPTGQEGDHSECVEACRELVDNLVSTGRYVGSGILEPPSCRRTVQIQEGRGLVTDGPFAETREHFAGYLLIQADSLDEATEIALRHPTARSGAIELLPVKDVSFT